MSFEVRVIVLNPKYPNPPTWRVRWGVRATKVVSVFYAQHHAEQYVRALLLNGTPAEILSESAA